MRKVERNGWLSAKKQEAAISQPRHAETPEQ